MSRERIWKRRATTLQDILEFCEQHIRNAYTNKLDNADCGDGTALDDHYLDEKIGIWSDLKEDVKAMLKKEAENDKKEV